MQPEQQAAQPLKETSLPTVGEKREARITSVAKRFAEKITFWRGKGEPDKALQAIATDLLISDPDNTLQTIAKEPMQDQTVTAIREAVNSPVDDIAEQIITEPLRENQTDLPSLDIVNDDQVPIQQSESVAYVPEKPISFSRDELDAVLNSEPFEPKKLLELFERDYGSEFAADAGVDEGYTNGEHTLMNMEQFEKYFSNQPLPGGVSKGLFRTCLVLHDIGKPEAIRVGSKSLQHEYTEKTVRDILPQLGFTQSEQDIVLSLIVGDPIGNAIQSKKTDVNAEAIVTAAQKVHMKPIDFFNLLNVYYMADASSYTEDAGGRRALDHLFIFDKKNNQISYAEEPQQIVTRLRTKVLMSQDQAVPQTPEEEEKARRLAIRDITKSTPEGGEERNQLARELRDTRTQERAKLARDLDILTRKMWTAEHMFNPAEIKANMTALETEYNQLTKQIAGDEVGVVTKALELVRPQRKVDRIASLQAKQGRIKEEQANLVPALEQRLSEMDQLQADLQRITEEKRVVKRARQTLEQFYLKKGKEYDFQTYKEKEGRVDVVANKYDAYIFHGFSLINVAEGMNNSMAKDTSIEDKFAVLQEYSPTLCTSSIKKGEVKPSLFSHIGVILKGGVIEQAYPERAHTVAEGLTVRRSLTETEAVDVESYKGALDEAFNYTGEYNELVVRDPKIAGLCINLDADVYAPLPEDVDPALARKYQQVDNEDKMALTSLGKKYNVPFFVIKEGVVHEAKVDSSGEIEIGKDVSPQGIQNYSFEVPEEKRDELTEIAHNSLSPLALV